MVFIPYSFNLSNHLNIDTKNNLHDALINITLNIDIDKAIYNMHDFYMKDSIEKIYYIKK